ncbi:MAG: hypothetical protein NTY37_11410 [Methanothrix sp.]|nr:hypothetical protein [Methanothrix sp.]
MDDIEKKEWEFLLEQYKSLREEQLKKMERQYLITGLGIGGVATLLSAAYQYDIYSLFLILPLVILAYMTLYEAESRAIINVGKYVKEMEKEIIVNHKCLGWENWLEPSRYKVYDIIDFSSRCIPFFLYIGCILGIITFPKESEYPFVGGEKFRCIMACIYIVIGGMIFLYFVFEQRKKRET